MLYAELNRPPHNPQRPAGLTEYERELFEREAKAFKKIAKWFGPGPYARVIERQAADFDSPENQAKYEYRLGEQYDQDRKEWMAIGLEIDRAFPRK